MTQSRLFEYGYSLILSSKYKKIRVGSSVALATLYPLGTYLLTGRVLLALILPLLYFSYMPLLLASYRLLAGRFGKSRFATSLAVGIPSVSSVIDLLLSLFMKKIVAFLSIILFNSVIQCTIIITNMNNNSKGGKYKSWIGSAVPTLLLVPYQALTSRVLFLPLKLYIVADVASLILAYASTVLTLKVVERTGGTTMLRLLSALLNSLADVREPFEQELSKLGSEVYTSIHLLGLETIHGRKLLLVIPYLHFGPFSGTVGSRLMYDIVHTLERHTGAEVVLLHGVGSHELDVVSGESRNLILSKCIQAASELFQDNNTSYTFTSTPARLCGHYICLTKIPFNEVDLVITTRLVNASDDIPLEIYRKVRDYYTRRKLVMIDAQNGFEGSSEWLPEEVSELRRLLKELSLQNNSEDIVEIQGAWTSKSVPFPEVGKLGVKVILLRYIRKTGSTDVLLIVFDSNNLKRSLREIILRELSAESKIVEVLTTDNHELVSLVSGKGYNVLGEVTRHEDIVHMLKELVSHLEQNLEKIRLIKYKPLTVRVKVLGEAGFNFIRTKLSDCIRKAKEIAAILILPQALCIIIFSILLSLLA